MINLLNNLLVRTPRPADFHFDSEDEQREAAHLALVPTHTLPCDSSTRLVGEYGRTLDGRIVTARSAMAEWLIYQTRDQFFVSFFQGIYALRGLSEPFDDVGEANRAAKEMLDIILPL